MEEPDEYGHTIKWELYGQLSDTHCRNPECRKLVTKGWYCERDGKITCWECKDYELIATHHNNCPHFFVEVMDEQEEKENAR